MRFISVLTSCFNEEDNILEIYNQVKAVLAGLKNYRYEHLFIDNASSDRTVALLKELAARDKNVKIIVNTRNFGPVRSNYYGLLQTQGEAAINIAADLQDPPALIADFLKQWEAGYKIVVGVKKQSQENQAMFAVRRLFYNLIGRLSEVELIPHFSGFGLYDRHVIEVLRSLNDPYPYLRGLISDLGFEYARIDFVQPRRARGKSKCNFYILYDSAMLGITNYSKLPLRLAAMLGFLVSLVSLLIAAVYLVYKLIFWNSFDVGMAPLVIGLFFFSSVQLFFIGIIGEYVGAIHTQVLKRPLVIEKERINF